MRFAIALWLRAWWVLAMTAVAERRMVRLDEVSIANEGEEGMSVVMGRKPTWRMGGGTEGGERTVKGVSSLQFQMDIVPIKMRCDQAV
ncbi:hypothetical protein B0H10DRAFT_2103743, partial [Mycena sp. CBHHK59/15]